MTNFKRKTKEKGLTAYQIAKDTGVNVSKIASWMRQGNPRVSEDLLKVLKYCENNGVKLSLKDFLCNTSGN